jgi:hypothetical protein
MRKKRKVGEEGVDWFGVCELIVSQWPHIEITERFIAGYELALSGYPEADIRAGIAACLREPGRKEHPKSGEIISQIQRLARGRTLTIVEPVKKFDPKVIDKAKEQHPWLFK